MKVKLQDVVDQIGMQSGESAAYLNKKTGEFFMLGEDEAAKRGQAALPYLRIIWAWIVQASAPRNMKRGQAPFPTCEFWKVTR
jgi:hypothetical protein